MKKSVLALLCAICLCAPVFSQTSRSVTSLDGAVQRLQTLSAERAIEKAYLHLDRLSYSPGDTVYFKAYVTLGEQRELSKLSGLLHVDLIDPQDSLLQTLSLQLVNGLAKGDFSLDGAAPTGVYRVRAYTRWMLNNGQTNFFNQYIVVNNLLIAGFKKPDAVVAGKPAISFFAEGGNWVNDVPAKLAFKAVGASGMGINVKGVIVDNANTEVVKFETKHLGMGLLFITPEAGKTYKANLTYADGSKATVDLPKPDNEGMTLTVNNDNPDKLAIEINANKPYYLKNKNKEIGIVIYSGGSIRTVKTVLDNQVLDLNLNKKEFKTGIVQITLFSAQGEPLNERLAFIQNPDLLNIVALNDKPVYATRGKVHISINTKNKDGMPVSSYLSAVVIAGSKVNEDAETTILSNLLLTSELRGQVEQPNYYFTNVNADTRSNLDVLMLTQGYRRFEWKQLLSDAQTTTTYKAEGSFDISGQVKTLKGEPVDGGTVTLMPQAGGNMLTQVTGHDGKFTFANLVYDDKTRFIIQAKTAAGKSNTQITITDAAPVAAIEPGGVLKPQIEQNNTGTQPVYFADISRRSASIAAKVNRTVVTDQAAFNVKNTGLHDQTTLSTGLQGRLNGVVIRQGVPYLADKVNASMQGGPMLIIMDDVALPQGTSVDNYSATDIESVSVLKTADASIYGIRGANGVLILKTRKNAAPIAVNSAPAPGLLYFTAKGFYKARTFYAPVYESTGSINNKPDNRGTVYWNPDVTTGNDGMAGFDFFNADTKGTYRVVIEGIDAAGNVGRSVSTYKVE
ncbi:carboxypeptidase-like regulatory domain-containing protein [Mucilaginibacter celer]|uniref:Macroglobulin domain-containing protein n=1 Tax=Mucilaginibacter celer TaxID=2305508 RepID=A0A494VMH4_9SPHI|nr:MG2 domain-containing protein [Mucilaginibacter celer]AYL94130.1 hypothetical protein HYN43_001935 [Mucilaginibacter celer]